MWQRFFCLGPSARDIDSSDWVVSRTEHANVQALYSSSKILAILEDEINSRYNALEGKKRVPLPPDTMRRLHRANLPLDDSQRASEILSKLTIIDNAKIRYQKEYARIDQELARALEEKRLAEFGQAKAEQLAIARGGALYRCQERLAEAETQQVQLAEVLKLTLNKLGMSLTPSPAPGGTNTPAFVSSPLAGQLPNRPVGPLVFSPPPPLALPQDYTGLCKNDGDGSTSPDTPLSGFTIYSNELHDSPSAPINDTHHHRESATKWKDISQVVAETTNKVASSPGENHLMVCATPIMPYPQQQGNRTACLDPDAEAEKLAELIIPHLEPSQLESLVRLGASFGSPVLASPTMQRCLLDALQQHRSSSPLPFEAPVPSQPETAVGAPKTTTQEQQQQPPKQQQQQQPREAFVLPPQPGPLSQASAWSSPGLHHRMASVKFDEAKQRTCERYGEDIPSSNNMNNPINMPAPPIRKSTFRVGAHHKENEKCDGNGPNNNLSIKAVHPQTQGCEEDRFARQRRAAERLAQKINSKLPPEYRTSDPLGLGIRSTKNSNTNPATAMVSVGGGSAGRRPPRGSLRRRAEEELSV